MPMEVLPIQLLSLVTTVMVRSCKLMASTANVWPSSSPSFIRNGRNKNGDAKIVVFLESNSA